MDEVENASVTEEVASPTTSQEGIASREENTVASQQEDRQERNWRAMRQRQEELEKRSKMQEEINLQLMAQLKANQVSTPVKEEEDIAPDDYATWGKAKKYTDSIAEKKATEAVERAFQQREQSQFLTKLKSQFSDFEEVVNPETLSLLEINEPELAGTIAALKDPYKMGFQTYKYLKSSGLLERVPSERRSKEIEKKIEQNKKTVQSPQVFDKRPMAQAFKTTDAEKKDLYREMMEYSRLASSAPNI